MSCEHAVAIAGGGTAGMLAAELALAKVDGPAWTWIGLAASVPLFVVFVAIEGAKRPAAERRWSIWALALLAIGGLGLGTVFSSILAHLTAAATPRYAADISGVLTTTLQIAGTIGVAAFGTMYLSQITGTSAHTASKACGVVTTAFTLLVSKLPRSNMPNEGSFIETETPGGQARRARPRAARRGSPG